MNAYMLDQAGLIFSSFALVVTCFAVFGTHRFFRLLNYGRETTLTRSQVLVVRIPGAVVIAGLLWLIGITLFGRH